MGVVDGYVKSPPAGMVPPCRSGGILFAVEFAERDRDDVSARFAQSRGEPTDPPESPLRLLDWLPPFALVTGIARWVLGALPRGVGIASIVGEIAAWAPLSLTPTAKT